MPRVRAKHYPQTGPLSTIEDWVGADKWLVGWQHDEEKSYCRWLTIHWLWYETLLRSNLSKQQRQQFASDLSRARKRAHDWLLGGKRLSKWSIPLCDDPPHAKLALAVREPCFSIPLDKEAALRPEILHLSIDLTQPNSVLIRDILSKIKEVRTDWSEKHKQPYPIVSVNGKHHCLARLVDVLWLHDKKQSLDAKWETITPDSQTFPIKQHATKVANLFSQMSEAALQGQFYFVNRFY
jgi:hypothetical protein